MNSKVNLVWATPDAENLIAFMARVSNPANQDNTETAPKLLSYLMKHKHWSPFEMVNVCMEIQTTRDIARQILRHRSFSFQEFSQRYAVAEEYALSELRLQDTKNRQNSIQTDDDDFQKWWKGLQRSVLEVSQDAYESALKLGVAKETARKVLPEGLTMSRMYMNGTLRSWIHYVEIRTAPETQKEHRQVALQCAEVLQKLFPSVIGALK